MGFRSGDGLRPSQSVGHAVAAATSTLDSTNKGRAAGTKYVPISCSLRRGGLGSAVRLACWSSGEGDDGTTGSAVRMGPGETSQEVDE